MNHDLMAEALKAYKEIVPEGRINSSSDCTAQLIAMLHDGRLEAAIVTLPTSETDFTEHFVCEDKVLICLRRDNPAAALDEVPKKAIEANLKIMFNRDYHPELHDEIRKAFKKAGMVMSAGAKIGHRAPRERRFAAV